MKLNGGSICRLCCHLWSYTNSVGNVSSASSCSVKNLVIIMVLPSGTVCEIMKLWLSVVLVLMFSSIVNNHLHFTIFSGYKPYHFVKDIVEESYNVFLSMLSCYIFRSVRRHFEFTLKNWHGQQLKDIINVGHCMFLQNVICKCLSQPKV